ncbi:tetratricopeptide repeat protein [Roseibium sp. M-1]
MRRLVLTAACVVALDAAGMSSSIAAAKTENLVDVIGIMPPDADYETVCAREGERVALITDWAKWDGLQTDRKSDDLFKIAREYSKGSDRLFANPDTASRILAYLEANRHDFDVEELRLAQAENVLNAQQDAFGTEAIESLQQAIDAGSVKAATLMARYIGPEAPANRQDLQKAAQLYAAAARAGNLEAEQGLVTLANTGRPEFAMTDAEKRLRLTNVLNRMIQEIMNEGTCSYLSQIGNLYLLEKYITKQNDVALAWLRVQAELGDGVLAELLGRRLKLGRFFDYHQEKSIELFKIAAEKGRPKAMLEVGQAHIKRLIANPSEQLGEDYLLRAADAKLPKAYELLAKYYRGSYGHQFRPERSAEFYEKAAAAGEKREDMLFGLGKLLMLDTPVHDPKRALAAFEGAADLGHEGAAREAANLYLQELIPGQSADYVKAVRLFRFAAISGDSAAARTLSKLYRCGEGLPYEHQVSETWMDKAAFLGSSESMYELSLQMLRNGMIEHDEEQSMRGTMLLRRAAHDGSAKAIATLALAYEKGTNAISADPERYGQLMAYTLRNPFNHQKIFRELAVRRFTDGMDTSARAEIIRKTAEELRITDLDPVFVEAFAERASTANEASDQFQLAHTLLTSGSNRATTLEAIDLLEEAADDGYVKAKIDLVRFSTNGYSVDALEEIGQEGVCSVRDALALASAFAEMGTEEAAPHQDRWLDRAGEIAKDDPFSALDIALAYWKGAFGEIKRAEAESFLLKSLELGQEKPLLILAEGHIKHVWENATPEKGAKIYRDLAASGQSDAAHYLLRFISQGKVKSDFSEIEQLLSQVRTVPDLKSELAPIYLKLADLSGKGAFGDINGPQTLSWLQDAADGNSDPVLLRRIAEIYLNGQMGVSRDLQGGMQWMLKAAQSGDRIAAERVARSYEFGFVFEKNASLAAEWDQKAEILQE